MNEGTQLFEYVGTLLYQPPELLQDETDVYDERVDIWSFGCIIYQLCTLNLPFGIGTEAILIQKIKYKRHNTMPDTVHQDYHELYEVCMNKDYNTRPTAA